MLNIEAMPPSEPGFYPDLPKDESATKAESPKEEEKLDVEGMMLAILLLNVFAPLIDHYVIAGNIKRRMKRMKKIVVQ